MLINKIKDNTPQKHKAYTDMNGFPLYDNKSFYMGRSFYLPGGHEVVEQPDYYLVYYVLEGELTVTLQGRDEPVILHKGDSVCFEPGDVKCAANNSVAPTELVVVKGK